VASCWPPGHPPPRGHLATAAKMTTMDELDRAFSFLGDHQQGISPMLPRKGAPEILCATFKDFAAHYFQDKSPEATREHPTWIHACCMRCPPPPPPRGVVARQPPGGEGGEGGLYRPFASRYDWQEVTMFSVANLRRLGGSYYALPLGGVPIAASQPPDMRFTPPYLSTCT